MEEEGFFSLPVHPIIVHFPIVMLTIAWALLIVGHGLVPNQRRALDLAPTFEWIGVATFVPTVLTGFRDAGWFELMDHAELAQPLIWHVLAGLATIAVFTAHALWRRKVGIAKRQPTKSESALDLGLPTFGFWLLVMTGLLAGEVVFG